MQSADPLSGRVLSAFPLSVGTSLAFESIFQTTSPSIDPERVIPQFINIADYQEFWINLSTLFRNLMGALPKQDAAMVGAPDLAASLMQEMEFIQSLAKNEGGGTTKVIFYVCEYKKLMNKASQYVKLKGDDTVNQKIYAALRDNAIKIVLDTMHQSDTLRVYDSEIGKAPKGPHVVSPLKKTALIISHIAWDLTSYKNFITLDLLESHTGVLKKRAQWYTKYTGGKELQMIPFMEGFFSVFGDSEHFRPMDIRLRKDIVELANENRWTQLTTREKVKSNLDQLKNPYYRDILKSVL